jgi:dihydrofolate synthase/folylpolyglutamate synthase
VKLLFAVMRDKDWRTMVPLLAPLVSEVVVTRVQQPRAEDPAALQAAFAPFCPVRISEEVPSACRQMLATIGPNDALLITGSLFLVGEAYPVFSPTVMKSSNQTEKGS